MSIKNTLHWAPKSMILTYIGLFGALGYEHQKSRLNLKAISTESYTLETRSTEKSVTVALQAWPLAAYLDIQRS